MSLQLPLATVLGKMLILLVTISGVVNQSAIAIIKSGGTRPLLNSSLISHQFVFEAVLYNVIRDYQIFYAVASNNCHCKLIMVKALKTITQFTEKFMKRRDEMAGIRDVVICCN